jgi:hypothetical protein
LAETPFWRAIPIFFPEVPKRGFAGLRRISAIELQRRFEIELRPEGVCDGSYLSKHRFPHVILKTAIVASTVSTDAAGRSLKLAESLATGNGSFVP